MQFPTVAKPPFFCQPRHSGEQSEPETYAVLMDKLVVQRTGMTHAGVVGILRSHHPWQQLLPPRT